MAVLNAPGISRLALELLTRSLVLPRTAARPPGSDFTGPNGATISVRVRQTRTAGTQASPGAPISYAGIDEVAVPVTLVHHYDATRLTDEDLTLGIEDYARQVLAPQTAAVATAAENQIATVLNALDPDVEGTAEEVETMILEARETLTRNEVPLGARWLAVSPEFATPMLELDKFSRVDASGSPSALRDAVLGKVYGLMVVESPGLTAGTAVAYHESGLLFANRAPAVPQGAASAATASADGIAVRTLTDFDSSILSDVSVVSTFAGAAVVHEDGTDATDRKRLVTLDIGAES